MEENNSAVLCEFSQKLKYIEEQLKTDLFSNPIREIQENLRNQLVDFSMTFHKNLNEAEEYIISLDDKKLKENLIQIDSTEEQVSKKLLEKKEYQCEILKKAFDDYDKKQSSQIEKLTSENNKLKYRIGILLDTINKLEIK